MAGIEVAQEQVRHLEGGDLVTLVRDIALEVNRLQGLLAVASHRVWDASEGHGGQDTLTKEFGCRSSVELLQRLTGEPASVVSARLKVGHQVAVRESLLGEALPPKLGMLAAGLESGRLNIAAAAHISKVLVDNARAHAEDLDAAERCLVQAATGIDFGSGDEPGMPLHADDIRRLAVAWDAGLDPDGVEPNEEARDRKRFLNIGPIRDGMARINGLVKAEVAAMFTTIMDTVNNPRATTSGLPYLNDTEPGDHGGNGAAADAASAGAPDGAAGSVGVDGGGTGSLLGADPAHLGAGEDASEAGAGAPAGAGSPPDVAGDPTDDRSWGQRRHDALAMALGVTLADVDLPILQGAVASIVVEIKAEDLPRYQSENITAGAHHPGSAEYGLAGADAEPHFDLADPHFDLADPHRDFADPTGYGGHDGHPGGAGLAGLGGAAPAGPGGVGWLVDHEGASTPVSLGVVEQMACSGSVQAVVRNSLGKIAGLGSQERLFTALQRRSIALRDQGCVIPGCRVPSAWCEIHHVQPHSEGGPTHTDNGVVLCRYHHSTIDTSGWVITMHAGIPYVRPPKWLARLYERGHDQGWVAYAMGEQIRRIHDTLRRQKHRRRQWATDKPPGWDSYAGGTGSTGGRSGTGDLAS